MDLLIGERTERFVVRGDEDGPARCKRPQGRANARGRLFVEGCCRLVEQYERAILIKGACEAEALALSLGEPAAAVAEGAMERSVAR